MSESNTPELSTDAYKGVRDFYPDDKRLQNYLFSVWHRVAQRYGYEEVDASIIEPHELYAAKSGEEIVNEQTYTFEDRGGREVTLRPEMTPTIARMIAGRARELAFPVRWYSIPNLFRYEKPQRGRLREHWQLNVDIFGAESKLADVEIILLSQRLLKEFGAADDDFVIHLNSRALLDLIFDQVLVLEDKKSDVMQLVDKRAKMEPETFNTTLEKLIGNKSEEVKKILDAADLNELRVLLPEEFKDDPALNELEELRSALEDHGVANAMFDLSLVRGFDYYTGTIFEVFDTHPQNSRSLFGGGRYDKLVGLFGTDDVAAVGFGMGDVTLIDFLETHDLIPEFTSMTEVALCPVSDEYFDFATDLAEELRGDNVNTVVDLSGKNIGTQIKNADKAGIPFMIVLGSDEQESDTFTVKELESGDEAQIDRGSLVDFFLKDEE